MPKYKIQKNNKNWQTKKLGEVCDTGAGGTPLKSHRDYYENGSIPWLRSGEICRKEITESELFITEKGLQNSSAKTFPKNTVLIAMYGATAGQVGILKFKSTTNQAICGILPNKNILPEFIYYFFLNEKENLIKQAVGGAQPNISQIKIKNTKILLPPIPEQIRIVKILDEAFGEMETAKKNAEKNLRNAKELFESYLQEVFDNRGDDWEEKKLKEVAKVEKIKNGKKDLPYIGMEDIESNSAKFLGTKEVRVVKSSTFCFNSDHILYGRLRPYLNKIFLPDFEGHCSTEIFPIKAGDSLNKKFLFYWFVQNKTVKVINETCTGTRMPRANMKEVFDFKISFPKSLTTQKQIVSKLDALSDETKKLEKNYQRKIDDLDELKKSVLKKAFEGEL